MDCWKFKKDALRTKTFNFWYEFTDGNSLKPEMFLEDIKQIHKLKRAIATIKSFEKALDENGLLTDA